MKGLNRFLFSLIFASVLILAAYLSSDNLIVALITAALAFAVCFFLFVPWISSYIRRERIRHEAYQFVNSFLITLSVCQSVDHAYEVARGGIEGEFRALEAKVAHLDSYEKIKYYKRYFDMEIYAMFVSVLDLYLERGGDVLSLSSELLNELARIEENGRFLVSKSIKNGFQFSLMWVIALAVMVFVRFGLNTFFEKLKGSTSFLLGIGAFFGFFLISSGLYLKVYVGEVNRKGKEYENSR